MEFLKVGKIVSVHGILGAVKVYTYTDDIKNLASYKEFFLDEKVLKVEKSSIFKNMLIVKFRNISTPDEAQKYIGKYLFIKKEEIKENDTYYVQDLIGCKVYKRYNEDEEYIYLGVISYVYTGSSNDVYEVKTDNKDVYLPAIKDVVERVDISKKEVYVKMMEGLE